MHPTAVRPSRILGTLAMLAALACGPSNRDAIRPDSLPPAAGAGAQPVDTPAAAAPTPAAPGAGTAATSDTTIGALGARAMGAPTAPVTVYEMSDFQCPYCRRHALETFPAIEREYIKPGKVRWVFINFPLTQIHPNAEAAAEFALCAAAQRRFWRVHDLLYTYQADWAKLPDPTPYLMTLADSVQVPRQAMLACLQNPATRAAVQRDAEGAARSGANSTPSFYIEGGLMSGAYPIEVFRQVLDSIYAAKARPKK
ncbi:MAG TPA: thioredoxin domain-containing protein [Gemmatimonadales bacterium]|nr:thioredoxin domain-containing protein [Gemmatimonadales bacterium]